MSSVPSFPERSDPARLRAGPLPYRKHTLVNGQPATIECIDVGPQTFVIERGPLIVVRLEDEWFDDVEDPERVTQALEQALGRKPAERKAEG